MKVQPLAALSLLLLPSLAAAQAPDAPPPAQLAAQPRGLLNGSEKASPGYTLLAPLRSHSTYLVDMSGKVVHEWKSDATPGHSVYLLDNGNLLRAEQMDSDVFQGGGQGGRLREIDWDGKVVWEYMCADAHRLQHHDFRRLPNGHVVMIAWELKTAEETLAAGRNPNQESGEEMWPDMVLEIEPTPPTGGKIVWEWHAWDHVIQDFDAKKANYGDVAAHPERVDLNADRKSAKLSDAERAERERLRGLGYAGGSNQGPQDRGPGGGMRGGDWLHTNAVAYNATLDVLMLSVHNMNEIWIVDHSTTTEQAKGSTGGKYGKGGDLLFRWGNPRMRRAGSASEQKLFGQHDAQWIADGLGGAGHVLIFNNGDHNAHKTSVDELAIALTPETLRDGFSAEKGPKVELAWSYQAPEISSGHISGAQRLPNGNTLICAGETGRIVEINAQNEVVWDFLSPLGGDAQMPGRRGGPPGAARGPGGGPGGQGGPPPGERRGPMRGPGGPGGPGGGEAHSLFRATRYAPDFPGLARLKLASPTTPGETTK